MMVTKTEIIVSSWLFIISSPLVTPSSIFEYTSGDSIVWVIPTSTPGVADSIVSHIKIRSPKRHFTLLVSLIGKSIRK